MALIKCNNCGHMISDKAEKCPKCGIFISQKESLNEVRTISYASDEKSRIKIWATSVAVILILIGGIGAYALSSKGGSTSSASNTTLLSVANKDNVEKSDTIVRITPEFTKAISKYDRLGIFNDGFAAVCKDEKWGYINVIGEEVIPTTIDAQCVGRFAEGLAFVLTYDGFNVINKDGNVVFKGKCYFDAMQYESSDMPYYIGGKLYVPIQDDKGYDFKYAVYDKQGNKIQTTSLAEGEKVYQENRNGKYSIFSEEHRVTEQGNYSTVGLKDSIGKEVLSADYMLINGLASGTTNFSNGVVLVVLSEEIDEEEEYEDKGGIVSEGTRYYYGYADMKGNDTFTDNVRLLCKNSMNNSTDSGYSEEQHYSQTTSTNNKSFNSWGDFCDYFRTTKKYQGRSAYFNGIIEIKMNDSEISVYVGGKYLSSLGLVRQDQEFLFGDYARMAVYVEGRTYPVVVHLPDSQHPYGYFYFEPIATSTNRNLAAALNLPIEEGWMWVEPQIENGKGTLVWHTDCKTKPTPIIYKLIE